MSTEPEFLCAFCNKPIDLTIDLNAAENGMTVHEQCYVNKITGGDSAETLRCRVG
jgi:hypothetical protein